MIEQMKKYPDINCDIEKTFVDKNSQKPVVSKLKIEQTDNQVIISEIDFDPILKKNNTVKSSGKIIAFNSFIQIAKLSLDNNIRWFDYKNKTFDTSRIENYMHFKTSDFKPDRTGLNLLIKIFNIALSLTSLENYAFSFWENADIQDNVKVYTSNIIKGFGVRANMFESADFTELKMSLIAPRAIIFDIEVGINFSTANQGYIKLFAMSEISPMIFKRIKNFFSTVHYIKEM